MMKYLLCILLLISSALANSNTLEFVVKSSPGGPDDTITRKIAEYLEKDTNLKFVVINKGGAGHLIGYNYFESKTTPALIVADINMSNHPVINSSERMFTIGTFSNILFVKNGKGITSLEDLIKLSNEREINFGHGGVGSFSFLAADRICQKILRCLLVPYKSAAPGMLDLLNGTIDAYAVASYGSNSFLENGSYKAIITYSTIKHPIFDVPPLPKKYKDIEILNWIAVYGKNLSNEDRATIKNSLNKMNPAFFIESGLYK